MMEHWVQLWALLLSQEQRDGMVTGCTRLQMVARNILYRTGWQHISTTGYVVSLCCISSSVTA
jgi:hypothetical protein